MLFPKGCTKKKKDFPLSGPTISPKRDKWNSAMHVIGIHKAAIAPMERQLNQRHASRATIGHGTRHRFLDPPLLVESFMYMNWKHPEVCVSWSIFLEFLVLIHFASHLAYASIFVPDTYTSGRHSFFPSFYFILKEPLSRFPVVSQSLSACLYKLNIHFSQKTW